MSLVEHKIVAAIIKKISEFSIFVLKMSLIIQDVLTADFHLSILQ